MQLRSPHFVFFPANERPETSSYMKKTFLLSFLFLFSVMSAQSPAGSIADPVKKIYITQKIPSGTIEFDGRLDEAIWQTVEAGTGFTQFTPKDQAPPSFQTEFRILYDDKYIYVGFRALDASPDSIDNRMGRRDEFPGDWMEINFDSYHDLRTAFSFTISSSGVRGDEYVSDNGNYWDITFNPIWDAKTHIDGSGWTAEAKIPFSQLRYNGDEEQIWGFQVNRIVFRNNERSSYQPMPQNGTGYVSRMAELHGLKDLPRNKGVEIAPYVVAQTEHFEKEEGNPFADGSRQKLNAGLDGKFSVTRDLILDYTLNPDFGQVEADPGAVRLDGYQVFFSERRPFFLESRNLFDYTITGSAVGLDFDSDLLFYSRRIGGAPHGRANLEQGEYAQTPQATAILGAAKFSGKTKNGWSIGLLESVTRREYAQIDLSGERRKELVEPLTSYFAGRLMKDYDQGNTIFGAVFTSVNREQGLDWLHRGAYSGGLDFQRFWKNRWYQASGKLLFSRVEGTPEAILQTQQSFERYFQRPGAPHVEVDSARTSLGGTSGTFRFSKFGGKMDKRGGIIKFEVGNTWRSPGFEVNDLGFMQAADEINLYGWAGYHIQRQHSVFRSLRFNYAQWHKWDFGGRYLFELYIANFNAQFLKNWNLGGGLNLNTYDVSNNALRGGSPLRRPTGLGGWLYYGSDTRKKFSYWTELNFFQAFGGVVENRNVSVGFDYQVLDALRLSLYPSYSYQWRKRDQYVATVNFGDEERTIVSEVDQRSMALTARLTWNLTPTLTVQYYGQPFIFRALYDHFAYVAKPLDRDYDTRFHTYGEQEISLKDGQFSIDETGDGEEDYAFSLPDFNFVQFRSNLVVRWEYVPGSELFLVWSQGALPNAYGDLDTPLPGSLFGNLFDSRPTNILLVKATYRFLR